MATFELGLGLALGLGLEFHRGSVEAPWKPPWRSMEVHGGSVEASVKVRGGLHGPPQRPPRSLRGSPWSSMEASMKCRIM